MNRAPAALFLLALLAGCGRPPQDGLVATTQVPAGGSAAAQDPSPERRYPAGSRVVLAAAGAPAAPGRVLSQGFLAAGAPAVSPDGRRVAFAGKRAAGSRWGIYESVRGGRARALIETDLDCVDPAYISGGRVVCSCSGRGADWSLYGVSGSGAGLQRLSFAAGRVTRPVPLADGRLLVVISSGAAAALYTVNPDGTWPELFAGGAAPPGDAVEAVPLAARAPVKGRPSEVDPAKSTGALVCYGAGARAAAVEFLAESREPLGRAAVESDGSFFVEVPADRPIRLRTLDGRGRAIATSGWFWLRPGESRSCAGCHEGGARMARNRLVEALAHDARRLEPAP